MLTSTLQLITNISPALVSGIVAAIIALIGQYYFFQKNRKEEQYRKLYGPLVYKLLEMKILTRNKEELIKEIKDELVNVEMKNDAFRADVNSLIVRWIEYKEEVRKLFEAYSGYIKPNDLPLVEDFLDGCIKREIAKEGQSARATEDRMDKLLRAIEALQEKLLKFHA